MLWVEKYRPSNLEEVVASDKIIEKIKKWADTWENHRKPLLLAGPPGTGKTSTALALANSYGWSVVELNASDQRSWQIINRIVGEGAFSETISDEGEFLRSSRGGKKAIILDEVDNIHKKEDIGGESALLRIIKKRPPQPIILIANNPYALSRDLRNACEMVSYKRIDYRSILRVLMNICKKEKIKADKSVLTIIAKNSGGDLRGAINDLQAIAEGKDSISEEDVATSTRTQETDIFKVLQKIFRSNDPEVYNLSMLLNESPEDMIWWISENLPLEYSGSDLLKSTLILSRSDTFLGRVRRRQYYRLWKYSSYLMTIGIQQAKKGKKSGFTRYKRPVIWQKLLQTRKKRERVRKILSKIGKNSHLSSKKAYNEMYFLIKLLLSVLDIERASKICAFYEFDEEDIAFLTEDEEKTLAISRYIEEHNLAKVDESFLSGFEDSIEEYGEDVEEKPDEEVKKIKGKGKEQKNLTLDYFFE